jgi:hypothetical protein
VNSVPRAFSPKVASKCCSVISPSLRSSPVPCPQHVDGALFPPDRVEQTVQLVQVGRISLHAGHVPADQLDGFIQSFLPPTRDENVSSFVNEQLGTGQRHTT